MGLRTMTTDRLVAVSSRLLTWASVVIVAALVAALQTAWTQMGVGYSEDGSPIASDLSFADRMAWMAFATGSSSYQILIASGLVAAAVLFLTQHPSWERARRLRWEVLGAGGVVFAAVVPLIFAHLYLITASGGDGADPNWYGPGQMTGFLSSLAPLGAALLILVLALLWWLRLGVAPSDDDDEESGEHEPESGETGEPQHAGGLAPRAALDAGPTEELTDEHAWSPEDFRRPV